MSEETIGYDHQLAAGVFARRTLTTSDVQHLSFQEARALLHIHCVMAVGEELLPLLVNRAVETAETEDQLHYLLRANDKLVREQAGLLEKKDEVWQRLLRKIQESLQTAHTVKELAALRNQFTEMTHPSHLDPPCQKRLVEILNDSEPTYSFLCEAFECCVVCNCHDWRPFIDAIGDIRRFTPVQITVLLSKIGCLLIPLEEAPRWLQNFLAQYHEPTA